MRSSGISRNSHMWRFQFSIWLKCSLERYILLKIQVESEPWFQGYEQLKDSQNNRKQKEILAISHNQCCRLPTDPARSQHISIHVVLYKVHCKLHIITLATMETHTLNQNSVNLWRGWLLLYIAYFTALHALVSWLAVNAICCCCGDFYECICAVRDASSAS